MTKTFLVINSITLVFILIFDVFYMISHGLFVKSVASIMFVTTGTVNLVYCIKNKSNLKFPIWMIIALVFAMLGDILFSDCMIMLEMFGGISVASYLCLLTYYPAQFLLAFSLLVYGQISLTKNKKVLFKD